MNEIEVKEQSEGHGAVLIKEQSLKVPVFSFESSVVWYLSKREEVLARAWVDGFNVAKCQRILKEEVGTQWTRDMVLKVLARGRVKRYVDDLIRDRAIADGITSKDKWFAMGARWMIGKDGGPNRRTHDYWKEIGKAMGWYVEDVKQGPLVNINLTQANGSI